MRNRLSAFVAIALVVGTSFACGTSEVTRGSEAALTETSESAWAGCNDIRQNVTRETIEDRLASLVQTLKAAGSPNARAEVSEYFDNGHAWAHDLELPLREGGTVIERVIKTFEGLGSPIFAAGELAAAPYEQLYWDDDPRATTSIEENDTDILLARRRVGRVPASFASIALRVLLRRHEGVLRIEDFSMSVPALFATEAEAVELARCTPDVPTPLDAALALPITFWDREYPKCVVGDRVYVPNPRDQVSFYSGTRWVSSLPTGRWQLRRGATLTIDPSNYWPGLKNSLVECGENARINLRVHPWTGKVLWAGPGGCNHACMTDPDL